MNESNIENLELGNIMFHNNTIQSHICPEYIIVLLRDLGDRIDHLTDGNPFQNTGTKFKTETFEVEAYSWDEEKKQPYNFKYKEIEISWYKCLGRDTTINGIYNPEQIIEMYNDCVKSLSKIQQEKCGEEDDLF